MFVFHSFILCPLYPFDPTLDKKVSERVIQEEARAESFEEKELDERDDEEIQLQRNELISMFQGIFGKEKIEDQPDNEFLYAQEASTDFLKVVISHGQNVIADVLFSQHLGPIEVKQKALEESFEEEFNGADSEECELKQEEDSFVDVEEEKFDSSDEDTPYGMQEEKLGNSFIEKIGYSFTTDDIFYAQEGRIRDLKTCEVLDDHAIPYRQNSIEKIRFNQHFSKMPSLISEIELEILHRTME